MKSDLPTLAIYAIQDRLNSDTPFYVHDHAFTLMHNGKVIKHVTQERKTRKKHDNTLHQSLVETLKTAGLLNTPCDLVFPDNIVGRAVISACGQIRYEAPLNDTLQNNIEKGRCWQEGNDQSKERQGKCPGMILSPQNVPPGSQNRPHCRHDSEGNQNGGKHPENWPAPTTDKGHQRPKRNDVKRSSASPSRANPKVTQPSQEHDLPKGEGNAHPCPHYQKRPKLSLSDQVDQVPCNHNQHSFLGQYR